MNAKHKIGSVALGSISLFFNAFKGTHNYAQAVVHRPRRQGPPPDPLGGAGHGRQEEEDRAGQEESAVRQTIRPNIGAKKGPKF